MELDGYECYANGTVKPKKMFVKKSPKGENGDQFYGSDIVKSESLEKMKKKKQRDSQTGSLRV